MAERRALAGLLYAIILIDACSPAKLRARDPFHRMEDDEAGAVRRELGVGHAPATKLQVPARTLIAAA